MIKGYIKINCNFCGRGFYRKKDEKHFKYCNNKHYQLDRKKPKNPKIKKELNVPPRKKYLVNVSKYLTFAFNSVYMTRAQFDQLTKYINEEKRSEF